MNSFVEIYKKFNINIISRKDNKYYEMYYSYPKDFTFNRSGNLCKDIRGFVTLCFPEHKKHDIDNFYFQTLDDIKSSIDKYYNFKSILDILYL